MPDRRRHHRMAKHASNIHLSAQLLNDTSLRASSAGRGLDYASTLRAVVLRLWLVRTVRSDRLAFPRGDSANKSSLSVAGRRAVAAALLLLLMSVTTGCTPSVHPMDTLAPKSDLAQWIYGLYLQVTAWDALIFAIVVTALFLALFVFSTRGGEGAATSSAGSDLRLEAAWTVGPALILLFIAIPTVRVIFRTQPPVPPPGSLIVRVVAHQWWWEFFYPALGIHTANELHIPLERPIRLELHSADVIHSFWVPELGGKRDVVPGQTNELTFIAHVTGEYPGQCAEFCGLSHANMRFKVFVESPAEFSRWTEHQLSPRQRAATPGNRPADAIAEGERIFAGSPCTSCHAIAGVSKGTIAPSLTHFGSRSSFAGATFDNTPENLAKWIENPQALKPGAKMPPLGLDRQQVSDLVAYLESLK
jgi:cytochrome c oxidase subunit II